MSAQFLKDVDDGLSQSEKRLPSKYFYNKKGDELFIKIMDMPEYYLTRSEMEIFSEQTQALIESFQLNKSDYFELIELGAGDGTKTQKLLQGLTDQGHDYDYMPIDISKHVLNQLEQSLKQVLPTVSVTPRQGDYFDILESLKHRQHPKVILFLGSNIGNMPDDIASDFLYRLGENLHKNDKVLIGADLIKPANIIMPAYNDSNGITREFNINLLRRINHELGANFNIEGFEHAPEYDEDDGIATSYLKSKYNQDVSINAIGKTYQFTAGEKIQTEISRKYNDAILENILSKTDFRITNKFTDNKGYFSDYILNRE